MLSEGSHSSRSSWSRRVKGGQLDRFLRPSRPLDPLLVYEKYYISGRTTSSLVEELQAVSRVSAGAAGHNNLIVALHQWPVRNVVRPEVELVGGVGPTH